MSVSLTRAKALAMNRKGRHLAAFPIVLALALIGCWATVSGASASDDRLYLIGLDMKPQAVAASANEADSCVEVDDNQEFDVDVFVTNAEALIAWELRVDYNPDVLSLESADYNFLLTNSGGGAFPTLFDKEQEGRYFLAAAETKHPDTGTGVLARLHLRALTQGTSPITITSSPVQYGPRLTGSDGYIGDSTGDGLWDGDVTGGKVAVDSSCSGATPIKTPPPASQPTPQDPGGGGTQPTTQPGDPTGNPGSGAGDVTPTPLVADVGGSDSSGDGSDGGPGAEDDSGAGSGVDTDPVDGASGADGGIAGGGRGDPIGSNGSNASSGTIIMVIGGIIAAICIVVGTAFLLFRRPFTY